MVCGAGKSEKNSVEEKWTGNFVDIHIISTEDLVIDFVAVSSIFY